MRLTPIVTNKIERSLPFILVFNKSRLKKVLSENPRKILKY